MQITAFNESDLERIGIVCPDCSTESIFKAGGEAVKAAEERNCPGCGRHDFLDSFEHPCRTQFNWVSYYQLGKSARKQVQVRFYFRSDGSES